MNNSMWEQLQVVKAGIIERSKAQKAHGFYDDLQEKEWCEQEKKIAVLQKELEFANNEANFWRLRAEQENALYVDLQFKYKIMTARDGERRAVQKEYLDYLDMVNEKRNGVNS